jgi:hypothetical protein
MAQWRHGEMALAWRRRSAKAEMAKRMACHHEENEMQYGKHS